MSRLASTPSALQRCALWCSVALAGLLAACASGVTPSGVVERPEAVAAPRPPVVKPRPAPPVSVPQTALRPAAATPPRVVDGAGTRPSRAQDGAGATPPPRFASLPEAEPLLEPLGRGGPAQPDQATGQVTNEAASQAASRSAVPISEDPTRIERGLASWYGRKFHGRRTASGERYDMNAMTAAHPTLPLPSFVRVRNPANRSEVVVRINDRGPFHPGRIIDLSYAAALKLGVLHGVAKIEVEPITQEEIRTGSWRRDRPAADPADASVDRQLAQRRPSVPTLVPTVVAIAATAASAAVPEPFPVAVPAPAPAAPAEALTVPVMAAPSPVRPSPAPGFWVQIGAFRLRDGAESFQRRVVADLVWIAPALSVLNEAEWHRLLAGPYADRDEANGIAQKLRDALSLVPTVVERR